MEGVQAAAGRILPAEAAAVSSGSLPGSAPARTPIVGGGGEGRHLFPSQDGNFLQERGKIECGPCSDSHELEICRIDFEFMLSERRMRMLL